MIARLVACTRGAAAVEAALVLPILLLLGLGGADAGNLLLDAHKMKTGVAASARLLARAQTPGAIETEARNLAVTGLRTGGAARVRGWTSAGVTVSYRDVDNTGDLYTGGATIRVIRVEGVHAYTGFSMLRLAGIIDTTVRVAQEERWIG